MKKSFWFFSIILLMNIFLELVSCSRVKNDSRTNYIFGIWKCIKHDYSGYNKFDLEQADLIRSSKLHVEKNMLYYENTDFIGSCNYSKFNVSKYDTTEYLGLSLELIYSKKDLSKILWFHPVDNKGNPTCFNDCSILFLKQDTLINICGGYTFYLIKEKPKNIN